MHAAHVNWARVHLESKEVNVSGTAAFQARRVRPRRAGHPDDRQSATGAQEYEHGDVHRYGRQTRHIREAAAGDARRDEQHHAISQESAHRVTQRETVLDGVGRRLTEVFET